jgi:recombination protein RecT
MNNQPKPQKARFSVAINTPQYRQLIASTLSDPARARSFTAAITSAVAVTPALQECESHTIIAGALLGESLNLSPSPQLGQYYLVPFQDRKKGVTNAVFVLGYRGYIQLAIRSGYYRDIDAIEVRQGEYKGKDRTTGKPIFEFIEDDAVRESLPVIGYMAHFEYLNGFKKVLYWSKEKMIAHADRYSAAFSATATGGKYPKVSFADYEAGNYNKNDEWLYSSFWYKDFDAMGKKTMLRQLISKWGIMSIEMEQGLVSDNRAIRTDGSGIFTPTDDETEETAGLTEGNVIYDEPQTEQDQTPDAPKTAQQVNNNGTPKKLNLSDV